MKLFREISLIIIAGIIMVGVLVYAGADLVGPNNTPSATGVTLGDIYNKLSNVATTSKNFNPTVTTSVANFHDLEQIYNLLTPIDSNTIISGNTIMNVAGNYDVSHLMPENVALGVTYGTSSVGIREPRPVGVSCDNFDGGCKLWTVSTGYHPWDNFNYINRTSEPTSTTTCVAWCNLQMGDHCNFDSLKQNMPGYSCWTTNDSFLHGCSQLEGSPYAFTCE